MTTGRAALEARYGIKNLRAIEDFVEHADEAARVSSVRERYSSREADLMVEALIVRLGESIRRMSSEFVSDYQDLMLRSIQAARNVAAHGYDIVDHQLLWNAIDHRLPATANALRQILDS